ncbi:hypothetical protein [Phaeobacter inhibens]|uniref:hypothetical protein n=1 Tax=Phaeobacter inhibens TaxID=221822 RepID=UPI0021A438D2|nr:hypothetical protein [Phaeobacter inhibens]UWR71214.1 hypothetical protein K4L00_10970 [Phaeobacter inhibens]
MCVFRSILATSSFVLLAACQPPVPDSGPEAGFGSSPFDGAPATGITINGDPLVPPARVASEPLPRAVQPAPRVAARTSGAGTLASSGSSSDDIARETAAALEAARSNSGTAPIEASPANPAPTLAGNPRISDENDFDAVSSRQSIESDAERLARQRAQYQVVSPTAVPTRSGSRDPNIVRYALSTSNPRGQRIYSRSGINLAARSSRNCAGFASPELAQIAFLEAGGPKRDRQALDPDGDGYACGWDPAPYRLAVQN